MVEEKATCEHGREEGKEVREERGRIALSFILYK